jgi:hypothetical protein
VGREQRLDALEQVSHLLAALRVRAGAQHGQHAVLLLEHVVGDRLLQLVHQLVAGRFVGGQLVDRRQEALDLLVFVDAVGRVLVTFVGDTSHGRVHEQLLSDGVWCECQADLLDDLILLLAGRGRGVCVEQRVHGAVVLLDDGGDVTRGAPLPVRLDRSCAGTVAELHVRAPDDVRCGRR